jgi:hypothetical protein
VDDGVTSVSSVGDDNVLNCLLLVCCDVDVCDKMVEVRPLLMPLEECANTDVSLVTSSVFDTIDENVDSLFKL